MSGNYLQCDVLIIGSGAAGMSLALKLSQHANIILLCKETLVEGATWYAQGGVSAVSDRADSCDSHTKDTLATGAGLCDEAVVRRVVAQGPASVDWLLEMGVRFSMTDSTGSDKRMEYHLHQEGGHSHRRILHAGDSTGQEISTSLAEQVKENKNIILMEWSVVVDLICESLDGEQKHCCGAFVLDVKNDEVNTIAARVVVLASGGAGKVYLYTSNPDTCTGDGIAMAWRSGCRVANMEFIQFHPTCLYHPHARRFLISEALRGEGARLILPDGSAFMQHFDKRAELAPRDIVARAIDHEMKRLGAPCVYLDITGQPAKQIQKSFPFIYEHCLELGIDICQQPIPVVPAAHYTCGGVLVDQHGRTDISGLYAIGEVSYTGLHGANRMASNSLLECVVYAHAAFVDIRKNLAEFPVPAKRRHWDASRVSNSDEEVVVSHNWDEIRRFMWDYVGIVRTDKRLRRAWNRVRLLHTEIHEYYGNFRLTKDLVELRNISLVAAMIIACARNRCESRGLHYSLDYPTYGNDAPACDSILYRQRGEHLPVATTVARRELHPAGMW